MRAKLRTDSSLFAWGGVLNLKHAAGGFRSDELRHLHITHLELEAVYKTVQSFLRELAGNVVRLYCDNQAVVAMLSHFTSRNPELMRRMRLLWILLDLRHRAPSKVHQKRVGDTGEDGLTWVVCDDGNEEVLEMSKEKYEVLPAAVQHLSSWDAALQERWRGELGDSSLTELAVQMQAAALGDKMVGKYRPNAEGLLCVRGAPVAAGHGGHDDAGDERTWLPARHVSAMHAHMLQLQPVGMTETELLRACTYVVFTFVTFGRPDTGVPMQRTHISITGDTVSVVLHKEKGRRHLSSAIHSYINPTAVPDEHMEKYFGWTTPRW
ncbi:hypothetical protein CYMTET_53504 [Cymbomonas tetramitiformis]|uniref:Reverse transcriptase RNase H-like domain-containing protein n=1 Tax=Cymbomonas tetramitiformis TaxID=36881 RepID=A0AAE0EPN1_9CHLO|nr:hypothetical protein CYMTET_53504 [Cymbomonas tetramitiformis]